MDWDILTAAGVVFLASLVAAVVVELIDQGGKP